MDTWYKWQSFKKINLTVESKMEGRGQTLDYLCDMPMIGFLSISIFREFTLSQLNMDSPMFHVSLFFLITSDRTRCGHIWLLVVQWNTFLLEIWSWDQKPSFQTIGIHPWILENRPWAENIILAENWYVEKDQCCKCVQWCYTTAHVV